MKYILFILLFSGCGTPEMADKRYVGDGESLRQLKKSCRLKDGFVCSRLGFLYINEGKTEEALEILRQGLSNVPDDYDVYRIYVKSLRRAQKFDEIIENFHEKSYREISGDPEIWNNLGFAYGKKEKWNEAIDALNRAVSIESKYPEAFYNLGDAYRWLAIKNKDRNLLMKSSENFQKAINADPSYPSPYFGLGRTHQLLRNLDEAIYHFKKALELQPDFGTAYYYLGLTYLEKGEKSQALECFVTIKEKFSSSSSEEQKRRIDELIKQCKDKI